jgi:uncharacterized protein YecT (DUF1311 family)
VLPLALALLLAAAPAAAAPSFDCTNARRDDEKATCADPALSTLDVAVDRAYRRARERLRADAGAQGALRDAQRDMIRARAFAADHPRSAGLRDYLAGWRDALERVAPPRPGFAGGWATMTVIVDVRPRPDGRYGVRVEGSDPIIGAWRCEYDGIGDLQGDRLVVTWNREEDGEDGAEGWLLHLSRKGALLTVEEVKGPDAVAFRPYCGHRGFLGGAYWPAEAAAFAGSRERGPDRP